MNVNVVDLLNHMEQYNEPEHKVENHVSIFVPCLVVYCCVKFDFIYLFIYFSSVPSFGSIQLVSVVTSTRLLTHNHLTDHRC